MIYLRCTQDTKYRNSHYSNIETSYLPKAYTHLLSQITLTTHTSY